MNAAGAIGATTEPSVPRRGATLIGLRRRTSSARAGSVISAPESVTADASSPPAAAARLCSVPPEIMSEGRGMPGGPEKRHLEVGLREPLAEALLRRLGGEQHGQVGRQRLEPGDLHDLDPGLRGAVVERVDHLAHERDLSRQVHVVRAARDARLDHRPPVQRVGADEVQHHARARGHRRERRRVAHLGDDRLRRGARRPRSAPARSFAGIARGRGPARAASRCPRSEVRGDLATGDPGRAEDDDVEVPLRGHARSLRRSGRQRSAAAAYSPRGRIACSRPQLTGGVAARCEGVREMTIAPQDGSIRPGEATRRALLAKAGVLGGGIGLIALNRAESANAAHNVPSPLPAPGSDIPAVSNVKDWGAVGDGVHDDQPNIQACIDESARPARTGGPASTYRRAPTGCHLLPGKRLPPDPAVEHVPVRRRAAQHPEGRSHRARRPGPTEAVVDASGADLGESDAGESNVRIEDLVVDCNGRSWAHGIRIVGGADTPCRNCAIRRVEVKNLTLPDHNNVQPDSLMRVQDWVNGAIEDCYLHGGQRDGLNLLGSGVIVSGNVIEDCGDDHLVAKDRCGRRHGGGQRRQGEHGDPRGGHRGRRLHH